LRGTERGERTIREINSAENPLVKVFRRSLAEGVTREGWLAIEGPFLLEEALAARERAVVHSVLVAAGAAEKFRGLLARVLPQAEVARVSDRLFARLTQTEAPPGIAALVELRPPELTATLAVPDLVCVVACGLQDPGNLGNMIRSAQALGAAALITLPETVSPFNPKAVRASAGTLFRLPVFSDQRPQELFKKLREIGVRLIAADRRSPLPVHQADLRGPLAILIGNEAAGLPAEILRAADSLVSIPIRKGTDSLNAATAASLFLYEAARQRGFKD
jgi:TrmH family RNA methyltransferase